MARVIGILAGLLLAVVLATGCSDDRICSADTDCREGSYCRESDGTCVGCEDGVDHPEDDTCVADSVEACGPTGEPCGTELTNGTMACVAGECVYSCGEGWTECESGCCAGCDADTDCPEGAYCRESDGYCVGCAIGVSHPENDTCVEDSPTACGPAAVSCGAAPKNGEAYCNEGACDYRCFGAYGKVAGGCGTIECTVDAQCLTPGTVCHESWKICVVSSCTGQNDFMPCRVVSPKYSYNICADEVCVEPGSCGDQTCNAPGPHFTLPDTGQTKCYDETDNTEGIPCPAEVEDLFGQDYWYGWDRTHDPSQTRFRLVTIEGDRLVDDNITGLEWQGCVQGLTSGGCRDGGGVCTGTGGTCKWSAALDYCDRLNWGKNDDWRLPDRYELESIVDAGRWSPAIDNSMFIDMQAETGGYFWSSSSYAYHPNNAWYVYFGSGNVKSYGKSNTPYVRCVRGGP